VSRLLRLLGLEHASPAERRATLWIAGMFFFSLTSTFLLRPLRDQFGVEQGPERMPWLYSLTLLSTAMCVPPFWWLANRVPSRRFVPIVQGALLPLLVLLAVGLWVIGDYQWLQLPWLGEVFWGGFSALNVVLPALVWIHAVEHFDRRQGQRLFGLIAVGGTLGAVTGSWAAGLLSGDAGAPPFVAALLAAAGVGLAGLCFLASLPACQLLREQNAGAGPTREPVASGGVGTALRLLWADGYLRAIAGYMMLLGMLATAFYVAQTELIGEQIERSRDQHSWLASVEFWSQALVLLLQVFCTGRLLRRLPATVFLVALPTVCIFGLGALWLWASVLALNIVQVVRRGTQFAFEKPAREVLYTPLDLETKHKVKFLLDTFAFRLGDLLGACLQLQLRAWDLGWRGALLATVVLALAWIVLGVVLGRGRNGAGGAAAA